MSEVGRRKRSSWGCVQRVAPNVYRLRWVEGGRRRSETVRGTRREADDRMAQIRVECGSGPSKRTWTVGEVYGRFYLPDLESRVAPSTLRSMESSWRVHVQPRWGAVALDDVRPIDLQEWLLTLTAASAQIALKVLHGVWRVALMYEATERNPLAAGFRMPTGRKIDRTRAVVAAADMGAYYSAALSEGLGAVFVLCACCGLRVGESLGVRAGEVSREEAGGAVVAAVPVSRQVCEDGEVRERLKTEGSARWSATAEPWASALLGLQTEALTRGDEWLTDDGTGSPRGQGAVRRQWGRALKRAGLERVPLQNLRATFATQMAGKLVPVERIARLMGHSKPGITYSTYERPGKEEFVAIAASAGR